MKSKKKEKSKKEEPLTLREAIDQACEVLYEQGDSFSMKARETLQEPLKTRFKRVS